ncbi:MAG: hypothetical protein HRT53_04590 [Colwellia sp.]|nr:hypothetical protein [Colwellia sp.]
MKTYKKILLTAAVTLVCSASFAGYSDNRTETETVYYSDSSMTQVVGTMLTGCGRPRVSGVRTVYLTRSSGGPCF